MRIKIENHTTAAEYFEDFILSKKAHGLSEKTLYSYQSHFHAAGLIIDWNKPIGDIRQRDIDQLVCHLRDKGLKSHTIATYIAAITKRMNSIVRPCLQTAQSVWMTTFTTMLAQFPLRLIQTAKSRSAISASVSARGVSITKSHQ